MPKYEITRSDGTTVTLAASSLLNALERTASDPEPVSARLAQQEARRGSAAVSGTIGTFQGDQPRHASFLVDAKTVGNCPVPGCDYIAQVPGDLHAHMLAEHGYSSQGAK